MARNVDNFPNDSETLSASVQQFHNSLFDDQNLTYDNFRPSIVSTPINSDHEVSIFEEIDDSSEESLRKELHMVFSACSVLGISNKKAKTGTSN